MKIVTVDEFLNLPNGILFQFYKPFTFDSICIKHNTELTNKKFTYIDLCHAAPGDTLDERISLLYNSECGRESITPQYTRIHDGPIYRSNELYAVYENNDIIQLITTIYRCLQ